MDWRSKLNEWRIDSFVYWVKENRGDCLEECKRVIYENQGDFYRAIVNYGDSRKKVIKLFEEILGGY